MNFMMKKEGSLISFPPFFVRLSFFLQELRHILGILPPLVYQGLHVRRQIGVKTYHLLGARMDETERLGMESLTRKELETILYELTVLGVYGSLTDFRTVVTAVIEEWMSYPVEMNADLVGTTGLETALYDSHISETFQDSVMRYRMLAMVSLRKNLETHPVVRVASDVAGNGSLILLQISPYYSHIASLYRMYEKLLGEIELRLIVLGHNEKSGSVLIDSMDKNSHSLILRVRAL